MSCPDVQFSIRVEHTLHALPSDWSTGAACNGRVPLIRDVVERAQIRGGTPSAVEPYFVTKGGAATVPRGGIESGSSKGGDIGEIGGIDIELGG